jgi:hypothetical protein
MNDEFLSGIWQDPVLHMILLQKLEAYPPFGAVREVNIDNVTAALNKSAASKLSAPLTRKQVEDRINRIVASQHAAFANVEPSDFTHPDFVRLHAVTDAADDAAAHAATTSTANASTNRNVSDFDAKRPAPPTSASKSKRARNGAGSTADDGAADTSSTTTTVVAGAITPAAVSANGDNPATAALQRDTKLVSRMRRMERSWRRYLAGEKLKEFAKLIYGAVASSKTRAETSDGIIAFVRKHMQEALVEHEAARFAAKSDEDIREVVSKGLEKNAVFFEMTGENGEQLWTIGDLAAINLDDQTGDTDE